MNHPTCGVCRLNLRHGDSPRPIRLAPEDVAAGPAPFAGKEPGLYSACGECVEKFKPLVAARQKKPAGELSNNALC